MAAQTFAADVKRFCAIYQVSMRSVVLKTMIGVSATIVRMSPVGNPDLWKYPAPKGYVGGRFRANWQYGLSEPPTGELDLIDESVDGRDTTERLMQAFAGSKIMGSIHYVANNLPYAMRLEEGWSTKQAPVGMVAISMLEAKRFFNEAVKDSIT